MNGKEVSNEAEATPGGLGLKTLPLRFLIAYTFLYMLPFPLSMLEALNAIPWFETSFFATGLQFVIGLHGKLTGPVVQFVGEYLTGQDVSMKMSGSGDSLASHFDILVDAVLALFLAVIWWAWRRSKPVSPIVTELNRVWLRYFLFTTMVMYGMVKFFPGGQFGHPGPDRLLQPYGDSSPMGLFWTFMGASSGYQIFSGAAEIVAGTLLLFRRTTLLGSLLTAAVMTQVFVLNLCYDVPVKLHTFHLLLFALLLAAPDAGRLFALFLANKVVPVRDQRAPWRSSVRWSKALLALKLVFVLLFFKQHIGMGITWHNYAKDELKHPLRGIYQVESFTMGDAPSHGAGDPEDEDKRWLRVGLTPPYTVTVQHSDGSATRMGMQLDMEASEMKMIELGGLKPEKNAMRFELIQEDLLRIEGDFKGQKIAVKLRRDDRKSLLNSRGFHWFSEAPFDR